MHHTGNREVRRAAAMVAVLDVAATIGAPVLGVGIPRWIGFRMIMLYLVCANVAWWSVADGWLARRRGSPWNRDGTRILVAAFAAGFIWPVLSMLIAGHAGPMTGLPVWAIGMVQLWHMTLAIGYPVAALAHGVGRLNRWRARRRLAPQLTHGDGPTAGMSRREVLAGACTFAPVILAGGTTAAGTRQTGRFDVNRYNLPAPWLPRRLAGLTITQISDIHLGRLYRPSMLPRLIDAANALKSDLLVVTGDIVDMSNELLPPAMEGFRQLQHRHGMYLCVGNHDLIDDGDVLVQMLRDAGFDLLVNERRGVAIGGERLTIAGLDWAGRDIRVGNRPSHADHVRRTFDGYDAGRDGACIALAHHPHAFDELAAAGIPLTLSGHTHGGQLMLFPPRSDGKGDPARDVGVGRLAKFRYMRGFYGRDASTLFVNRGVGNWFPLRINSPAEIVQIRLI